MRRRALAGVFWFLAFGYLFQFAGAMYGFPPTLGSALALAVAIFMSVDPLGVLWKRPPTRRVAKIPEPQGAGEGATLPG